jgi:hypothetical protein
VRKSSTALAIVAAFAFGGAVAALALLKGDAGPAGSPPRPVWHEVSWPFPLDQWGRGKAFRCKSADCGVEVNVYVRAKIGFCNCTTGVADDQELDRIGDFSLLSGRPSAQGPGRPIAVAWMKGRSRGYAIEGAARTGLSALSVGFNDRCDAIIATAVVGHEKPDTVEPSVLEFLNSRTILRWAEVTLGL